MNEIGKALCSIEHPYKILDGVGLERLTTNRIVEQDVPAYRIRIGKYRVFVTIEWGGVLPSKSTDANTLAGFMPVDTFGYAQPYGRVSDQSISWEEPTRACTELRNNPPVKSLYYAVVSITNRARIPWANGN